MILTDEEKVKNVKIGVSLSSFDDRKEKIMRKELKLAALVLVLALMMTILGACAKTETPAEPATTETEQVQQTETPSEEAEEPQEAETPEEAEEPVEVSEEPEVIGPDYYYLAEDPTEISMTFTYMFWFANMFPDGYGNSPFWDEVEKALNIEFTFNELANNTAKEKINLMIAGDETTDIIVDLGSNYTGGLQAALDEEVIYDLRPYIEEYAPLYSEKLFADEPTLRSITNDNGTMGAMYSINKEPQGLTGGTWIRGDWLDAVGMDVPTTTDELYEVLKAFKAEFDCSSAYYQVIGVNNVGITAEGIWNSFGPTGYYLDNGQVKYGLAEDFTYDYLAYLKKLAEEGLFLTSNYTDLQTKELMSQNQMGVFGDNISTAPDNLVLMDDPDAYLKAMAALGEPTEFGSIQTLIPQQNCAMSVFTSCDYPELCVKMANYFFTDQGSLLANYGIEDLTFVYNEDGDPAYTDLIVNNPDGIPVDAALGYWTDRNFLPGLMDPFRTYYNYYDYQLEAPSIWATAYTGSSMTMPTVTLTTQETESISSIASDMNTYIDERVNQFVFGGVELNEASFKEFVDGLYGQNQLQKQIDVYQAAYERYLAQ